MSVSLFDVAFTRIIGRRALSALMAGVLFCSSLIVALHSSSHASSGSHSSAHHLDSSCVWCAAHDTTKCILDGVAARSVLVSIDTSFARSIAPSVREYTAFALFDAQAPPAGV